MPTLAELQVNVDSRPIEKATSAFNDFAIAADRANKAAKANNQTNNESSGTAAKTAKAEENLSSIIDAQTRKLEQLAAQRRKLESGSIKSTAPAEYERLNRIIDANIALVNRQGNAVDALNNRQDKDVAKRAATAAAELRAQDRLAAAAERRENVITKAAAREQQALDQTINGLSRQIKAQNEYNATIDRLNKARALSGMSSDNPSVGAGEYESLVKLATARRDAALATADNSRAIDAAKNKLDTYTATLGKVERAEVQFSRAVKILDDNLKNGTITQDQYNSKLTAFEGHRDRAIASANDNAAAEARFARELKNVMGAYDPVIRAQDQYNNSVGILAQGFQNGVISAEQFNRALTQQRQALEGAKQAQSGQRNQGEEYEKALNSLVPYRAELKNLEAQERALKAQKDAGAITTASQVADYDKATQAINRQRTELQKRVKDGNSATMSYKAEQAALRGVPAQITDIVVSLQGGQAPLTVLLQQGGQLKDMFGGVVPAFKALATTALSFITPVTAAVAVLGTLAYAAYQGATEFSGFNKALTATGGYAGVSASQFAQYRDSLDETAGTAANAAQALTLIAASGKIAGDSFLLVGEAAIKMERATGQALSTTIDDFAALGKDPVDAAVRLDEKYRFLTASVLAQADALVKQGKEQEAVTLLQDKMAEASIEASNTMIEQAGLVEKAWTGIKDIIKETWDQILSIGRTDTSADRIQELLRQRKSYQDSIDTNAAVGLRGFGQDGNKAKVAEIDKEIAQIQDRMRYEQLGADQTAKTERERREAVSETAAAQKRLESSYKGVEKAEVDLAKVRRQNEKIRAGGDVSPELNATLLKNEKNAIDALNEAKEKEAKKRKTKTGALDTSDVQEVRSNLKTIEAEYDGYYKRVTALGEANLVSDEATYASQKAILEAQKKAVSASYDEQIDAIKKLQGNKKNSAAQSISLENQLTKAEADRQVAAEKTDAKLETLATKERGRIEERTRNVAAYKAALDAQLQNLRDDGQRSVEGVGRGDRQAGVTRALADNDRSFNRQQRELTKSLSDGLDPKEYADKLRDLQQAHTDMADQIIANDKAIDKANTDWTNGFTRAIENAEEVGRNFAGSIDSMLSGAFDNAGSALATFVTTGKLNFKDFTRSVLADMATIAAKQAASAALSGLFRIGLTAASAYFGGGANGFAAGSAAATSSSLGASQAGYSAAYFKNGGGFSGGVQRFANGGDFTNSIVSTPTRFKFGDQLGEMGEAGPEAILPLQRTASGALGVRTTGGGMGGGTVVNVSVSVTESGKTSSSDGGAGWDAFGSELGSFVEQKVYKIINTESRPGGSLAGASG